MQHGFATVTALLVLTITRPVSLASEASRGLRLVTGGKTEYVIAKPARASDVDEYAVNTLADVLQAKTTAAFKILTPDKLPPDRKRIFVGLSGPARTLLGQQDPLASLRSQEYVVRNVDDDVLLYGKGKHGSLHAVLDFMENTLGRRCYSKFGKPLLEVTPDLTLAPFDRRGGFDFAYRFLDYPGEYAYQHGINMGFSERNVRHRRRHHRDLYPKGVVSLKFIPVFPHTTFVYVPPKANHRNYRSRYPWMPNRSYFSTAPEFFTMDASGNRVARQLCFSNPRLRDELTRNVLAHIRVVGDEDAIIMVGQEDEPGRCCKLLEDADSDVPALIEGFTNHQYGAAAGLVRQYLDELETARKAATIPMHGYTFTTLDFDREFAYLTIERLRRWQGYFDQMTTSVASDARCLRNVKRLRRLLNFATLARWHDLAKAYPDYFSDYRAHKPEEVPRWYVSLVSDCETIIRAGGKAKPLPEQFAGIDPSRIRRFVPTNKRRGSRQAKVVLDPDAAFGYAATIDQPDNPFRFGFFQWEKRHPPTGKREAQRKLAVDEITPGVYRVYKPGAITVTSDCMLWFGYSWLTHLQLGHRLYDPDGHNKYEAYVSLKFTGPT